MEPFKNNKGNLHFLNIMTFELFLKFEQKRLIR